MIPVGAAPVPAIFTATSNLLGVFDFVRGRFPVVRGLRRAAIAVGAAIASVISRRFREFGELWGICTDLHRRVRVPFHLLNSESFTLRDGRLILNWGHWLIIYEN